MSAFLVSDKHINTLITYANLDRYGHQWKLNDGRTLDSKDSNDLQTAAEILKYENIRSLQARYEDRLEPEEKEGAITFRFTPVSPKLGAVQILKACACYDYQACESDDYDQSDAKKIVDSIRYQAINSLPKYEEAEWEIGEGVTA